MNARTLAWILIAMLAAPAATFAAAFVSFQENVNSYFGTQDTRIAGGGSGTDPNANYGGLTSLTVFERETGTVNLFRDLIRFDLSSIAPGTPVYSASLTLTYIQAVNLSPSLGFQTGGVTNSLYVVDPLNVAWTESSATWNNAVGGGSPQPWASLQPGLLAGADYGAAVATAVTPNLGPTPNLPMTFVLDAAGIAAVQGWVNNPSTNTGFFIRQPSGTFSIDDFASSEHATTSFHPLFTLSIPEPASLGLVSVGALFTARRRR